MRAAGSIPEFVCNEDDSPFQQQRGKHLQKPGDTETLQQAVKIDMLQPWVDWAAQIQFLHNQRHTSYYDQL